MPDSEGQTLRGHLESVARQTGNLPATLASEPDYPYALSHLVDWFWDLSSGRGSTGFGPSGLSYAELGYWSRLTGLDPTPFEIEIIKAMDRVYLNKVAEQQSKTDNKK